jgi:hypothetical protein
MLGSVKLYFLCTLRKALWDGTHIFSSVNGKCWHLQLRNCVCGVSLDARDVMQRVTSD